jgi:hypothetical protein
LLWALAASCCAQLVIDPSAGNLSCTIIVAATTAVVILYVRYTEAIDQQPLSTLVLLGFSVTTQFGALLAQSLTNASLSASLRQPIATFATLAAYQFLAIATHGIYRLFRNTTGSPSLVRRSLDRVGLYATPSVAALWVLGGIGCASHFLPRPGFESGSSHGLLGVLALACNFLISAPFLIPVYRKIEGPQYGRTGWTWPSLAIYALVALLFAVVRNARVTMLVGAATAGLAYLLVALQSRTTVRPGALLKLAAAVIGSAVLIGPVSDLATAMAIARAERSKDTGTEMLARTVHVWQSPYLIQQYRDRERSAEIYRRYDEAYIANPLLARLVETKFHDNALYFSHSLVTRDSQERLTRITVEFLWAILPKPVLERLAIPINKEDLNFSMGDYLAYLSRGVPLGGHKTGSMFAQGQVVFGALFPFVYVVLCVILFIWMDLLCRRSPDGTAFPVTPALLATYDLIHVLAPESFHQACTAIIRGIPTYIAVYTLAFWLARLLTGSAVMWRRSLALTSSAAVRSSSL